VKEDYMKRMKQFNTFMLFGVFLLLYMFLFSFVFIFKYVSPLELFNPDRSYFRGVNIIPFHTIYSYLSGSLDVSQGVVVSNILGNIVLFTPVGIYLQLLKKNKKIWISMLIVLLTTFSVEMIQFIFGLGAIDIDDIILNCLGGFLGILIYKGLYAFFKNEEKVRTIFVVSGSIVILIPILITIIYGLRWRF
jgi:glycopeptide antibiotics resistance protein